MLPPELIDHILSFCEGHVRADLHVKNVSVPLRQNVVGLVANLGEKLLLEQYYTVYPNESYTYFVNKKNTPWTAGYVSKMVNDTDVFYNWVRIQWF
jgi:hypothetical protein